LPSPEESDAEINAEIPDLSDYNLAHLPAVTMPCRDVISERIYVGKAVLKSMFFND